MCKGYYDIFTDCPLGHMIRTAIVYCQKSVHYEGEKERHLPCENFDDAAETRNQYRVAGYPCPKCDCIENEYLCEQGRPWRRARERVTSHIQTGVLTLVYGGDVGKIKECEARIEKLRTIANGEIRAREYATKLERDLIGGEHQFQDKARRLAEKVRQDLEGIDIARMREDAMRLAQRLKRNIHATDEGAIDTWEHMDFCLDKEASSRSTKTKRLGVFPDERERIEHEENQKPEQYRVPKAELIFNWDHSQQGRPPSKKSRCTRMTFPKDTNPLHELPRLANHMQFDLPAARQAYEVRKVWNQSRKRKCSVEPSDGEEEDDDEETAPTPSSALQCGAELPVKRSSQTKRVRRSFTPTTLGRQPTAAETPSPHYVEDNGAVQHAVGLGAAYLSPSGRSNSHQSLTAADPLTLGTLQNDPMFYSFDGMPSTEAQALCGNVQDHSSILLDSMFACSPTQLAPSVGGSSNTTSLHDVSVNQPADSHFTRSDWAGTAGDDAFGYDANLTTLGEGPNELGSQSIQTSTPKERALTDPELCYPDRGTPFHGSHPKINTHGWSLSHLSQANPHQMVLPANPRVRHIRGDSVMGSLVPHSNHGPRSTEFLNIGASQGASSSTGYIQPGSGNANPLRYTTLHPSNTLLTNPSQSSANLSTLFPYLIDPLPDLPSTYGLNYTPPPTSFPTSHIRSQPTTTTLSTQQAPGSAYTPPTSSPMPSTATQAPPVLSPLSLTSPALATEAYAELPFLTAHTTLDASPQQAADVVPARQGGDAEGMDYDFTAENGEDAFLEWVDAQLAVGCTDETSGGGAAGGGAAGM